jgi:hypothetical protein
MTAGRLVLLGTEGEEGQRWERAVAAMPGADIYFTPAYNRLFADLNGDEAITAVWEVPGGRFLFPLQIRPLSRLPFMHERWVGSLSSCPCFDAASPYGYSGPLTDAPEGPQSIELMGEFMKRLAAALRARGVVSLFIRFHPLLGNSRYFPGDFLDSEKRSETVFIDLTGPWYKYLTSPCRYEVRKSERRAVQVEAANDNETWREFGDLYRDTMRRRQAKAWYVFPQAFFEQTRQQLGPQVALLVARHAGRIVAGSLFLRAFGKGHYHLSGSGPEAAKLGASNRLIVEGAQWCEAGGCATLHLGGGVVPGDGLWRFKASFSPNRATWDKAGMILDPDAYNALVQGRRRYLLGHGLPAEQEAGRFFPAYRCGLDVDSSRAER